MRARIIYKLPPPHHLLPFFLFLLARFHSVRSSPKLDQKSTLQQQTQARSPKRIKPRQTTTRKSFLVFKDAQTLSKDPRKQEG